MGSHVLFTMWISDAVVFGNIYGGKCLPLWWCLVVVEWEGQHMALVPILICPRAFGGFWGSRNTANAFVNREVGECHNTMLCICEVGRLYPIKIAETDSCTESVTKRENWIVLDGHAKFIFRLMYCCKETTDEMAILSSTSQFKRTAMVFMIANG